MKKSFLVLAVLTAGIAVQTQILFNEVTTPQQKERSLYSCRDSLSGIFSTYTLNLNIFA